MELPSGIAQIWLWLWHFGFQLDLAKTLWLVGWGEGGEGVAVLP